MTINKLASIIWFTALYLIIQHEFGKMIMQRFTGYVLRLMLIF